MDFPRPDIFGNYLLKDFGDIVLPADLPWWPIQPGWWGLLALLVMLCCFYGWRRYRHWRRNAYRREAVAALSAMTTLRDMNRIIKRATVAAYPSDATAQMWGAVWIEYLNRKTATACFIDGDDALFNCLLTQPEPNWPPGIEQLRDRVCAWLLTHREEPL